MSIEEKAEAFGRRVESLGHDAEAAASRLSTDSRVRGTVDDAGFAWGVVLLAAGLWLFASVTLHLDLPAIAWADVWPIALIVVGAMIVLRGLRRRA